MGFRVSKTRRHPQSNSRPVCTGAWQAGVSDTWRHVPLVTVTRTPPYRARLSCSLTRGRAYDRPNYRAHFRGQRVLYAPKPAHAQFMGQLTNSTFRHQAVDASPEGAGATSIKFILGRRSHCASGIPTRFTVPRLWPSPSRSPTSRGPSRP